jgi:outer membrane protein assembly factor BamB
LCDLPFAAVIHGPDKFPLTLLTLPFNPPALAGIDPATVRLFRFDEQARALRPIWYSGLNLGLGFVWAQVRRPGIFVPVGLPLDPVVLEFIRVLAQVRAHMDGDADDLIQFNKEMVKLFSDIPADDLARLRRIAALSIIQLGNNPVPPNQIEHGGGFHIAGIVLPGAATIADFKAGLARLEIPPSGLPEESLLLPPDRQAGRIFLTASADPAAVIIADKVAAAIMPKFHFHPPVFQPFCWLFSRDWPMYHHDESHSGDASGCSRITSTSVQQLTPKPPVNLPQGGTVWAMPTVCDGQIYICVTAVSGVPGIGGYLHKIDLATRIVTHSFPIAARSPVYTPGGGGSPAVVGGRIYFTGMPGWVYCLDASTFTLIWQIDLRVADRTMNQPVNNPLADSWSSPVVAQGRVYVGCGEGESQAYGFVYCLDAANGHVIWLYSTDQFVTGVDNHPNVIPDGAVGLSPLPAGFTAHPDPPHVGANIWSSCAYDSKLHRIYVGLGNSSTGGGPPGAIDFKYGSGVISLHATTGGFAGYFQPSPADSYYPTDEDIDICSSPLLFHRGGKRVVAIGSKSGAFMLLDAHTMAPLHRRNMLPRDAVTGNPLPTVDTTGAAGGENLWGVFGTPAVHHGTHRLFVGVGGYSGIGDQQVTPFLRALDWDTLNDAWPTAVQTIGANQVSKYTTASPPMYTTDESGLSSPAVVNDVVFVSTNKSALYAFDVNSGHCLWTAPGLPSFQFVLGPVIYGNHVIVGAGSAIFIYSM